MYFKKAPVLLLLLFACGHNHILAQEKGKSMISLSEGIVSSDEFNGVTYTSYMDIPYQYSGALFLSYRYFITDYCAIGVSCGIDDVKGNLTMGNPKFNGSGQDGTVGTYIRHTATFAPEMFLKYMHHGRVMIYGYAGIGYTYSRVEKAYNPQIYAGGYQNGVNAYTTLPDYLSAVNPLYITQYHINGQVTPFGLRVGDKIAWNMEVGFGYKGLINTGLSFVF